jgi:hypothetical protein
MKSLRYDAHMGKVKNAYNAWSENLKGRAHWEALDIGR